MVEYFMKNLKGLKWMLYHEILGFKQNILQVKKDVVIERKNALS